MNIENTITKIQEDIKLLSEKIPESSALALSVSNAINASAARAALWDSRLSTAARLTVASSVMDYVSYIIFSDIDYVDFSNDLNSLVNSAIQFAPLKIAEHKTEKDVEAPYLWTGDKGGPFAFSDNTYPLKIVKRPLLPGGNWSLLYFNIPISFGVDPNEVANKALKFIELRETKKS